MGRFRTMVRISFGATVFILCALWYTISSLASIVNKILLTHFPYPLTATLASLSASALYSVPLLNMFSAHSAKRKLTTAYMFKYIVPLSVGKIIAVAFALVSIWKVPVSYAHTVKASMPLFAVFTARFVLNEVQSYLVYMSLLPIFVGIFIASATELSFNMVGLLSALASTFTYSLLNAYVKRVLQDTGLHHVKILSLLAQVGLLLFLPIWCIHDGYPIWLEITKKDVPVYYHSYTLVMLVLGGFLNFAQNLVTFTLIHKLTALSYAVANAAKRTIVICASLLTLRNPITFWNGFGMLLAVSGVFFYNRAKQYSNRRSNIKHAFTHTTLSDATMVSNYENEKPAINQANHDVIEIEKNNHKSHNSFFIGDKPKFLSMAV